MKKARLRGPAAAFAACAIAAVCSGCGEAALLVIAALPGDKYERHILMEPEPGFQARGKLDVEVVGHDVVEISGKLEGLQPDTRYALKYRTTCNRTGFDPGADRPMVAQPANFDDDRSPYLGPIPELKSDGHGKLSVSLELAGRPGKDYFVLWRVGSPQPVLPTPEACGVLETVKIREGVRIHM